VANINGTGNTLDNVLFGNAGNNILSAGAGVDTLSGGAGIDTLVGALGNDVYQLDSATDTVTELVGQGVDLVQSSVSQAVLADNVENIQLTGVAAIDGAGNVLANNLLGNSANNTLSGLGGNDTLNGGAGIDTLIGGLGNDVYQVDSQTDVIVELSGEGTDFIQSSISYSMAGLANVERLVLLGSANLDGTGSDDANNLFGNTGNNVLNGGLGGDTLNGGAGLDTLIGGLGNDVFQVDSTTDVITENAGEGTDFVQTLVNYDLSLAANVERLTLLGGASINGVGNDLDNVLFGNAGNNNLAGGLGADTLNGAAGVDTLAGGQGNDTYQIDSTTDVITENVGEGTDTIQTSVSLASLAANVENVLLLGGSALTATGNALANLLTGNSGNNILSGGDGNDTLEGGAGIDTLNGGLGNDVYRVDSQTDVINEGAGQGTDFVQTTVSYILTAANVENLTLLGSTAINGTGNSGNNVVFGNSAANVLDGGAGNDTLFGGLGNDTFVFDTALNAATNLDTVGDFAAGDHLQLSAAIFTALTPGGALNAAQFFSGAGLTGSTSAGQGAGIYYDTTTGSMYYDADGFAGAAGVKFAVVTGHPAVVVGDLIVGP
jgi:Ca2+-binding RTX toxin-like protein